MLKNKRDIYYKLWSDSYDIDVGNLEELAFQDCYKQHKAEYQRLYRIKLTQYVESKTMGDFKSIKDYWNFHSSYVCLKSDKSSSSLPTNITIDGEEIDDPEKIANAFNGFFTNLSSTSTATREESIGYINNTFKKR